MSDQSAVSDGHDFGLIETLLWTPGEGFYLLAEHLARLRASSEVLGFSYDEARVRAALDEAARGAFPLPQSGGGLGWGPSRSGAPRVETPPLPLSPASREEELVALFAQYLRVRLVLATQGELETSVTPIEPIPPDAVWKVALASSRFSSDNPLLRHKTTRREIYENELEQAHAREGADEVLFLNERDEVCEGARCNVFLERAGALLTPPVSSGLLPGTLRAHLLASGRATESVLCLADFADGAFYMGNSVRGLVRAKLSDAE